MEDGSYSKKYCFYPGKADKVGNSSRASETRGPRNVKFSFYDLVEKYKKNLKELR